MAKLTTRSLASGVTLNDLIHIVITGDTSQDSAGSSYKASLSQLVPLFGGSPDVFVTGGTYSNVTGTATFRNTTGGTFNVSGFTTGTTIPTEIFVTGGTSNSTGGTMTFTNTTGGTFTVTGTTTPFSGGSGNCITSFYTNNIHACTDEITVHNRVQSTGSDAQNTLSFAFGNNVKALNNYTHAEGNGTIASGTTSHSEGSGTTSFGSYSHSEGIGTKTGTNLAYLATGLTSGVLYLSSSYGNVSSNFTPGQYMLINDTNYSGFIEDAYVVSASTYNAGTNQTIVYLTDTSLTTTGFVLVGDTNSPSLWGGNMVMGGYGANSKGSSTNAIGKYTLSVGINTSAIGNNSFASGKGTASYGLHSFSTGLNSIAYGVGSFVGGEGSITTGVNAFAMGYNVNAIGDYSHAEGSGSLASGMFSHAEGSSTASNVFAHAEGDSTIASGQYSHSQNKGTEAYGDNSHAGGVGTKSGSLAFSHGEINYAYNGWGSILGGRLNTITSGTTGYESSGSTIIGSSYSSISGLTPSDPVYDSSILGGNSNSVNSFNSSIISSDYSILNTDHSVIIGGSNITGNTSYTVYVPNLVIYPTTTYTPSGTTDTTVGEVGSVTWDNNYFYYRDNIGWKRLSGATW